MRELYITSKRLLDRIHLLTGEIANKSGGRLRFEEHIALPEFGQIILRFELLSGSCTLDELDGCERMMQEVLRGEFLSDFMGSVYKKAGVTPEKMFANFPLCSERYSGEEITEGVHAEGIRRDAGYLLGACGLSEDTPCWEIQPEDELNLLIFGDPEAPMRSFDADGVKVNLQEVDRFSCEGLMRAEFYAKRNGISLARALIQA